MIRVGPGGRVEIDAAMVRHRKQIAMSKLDYLIERTKIRCILPTDLDNQLADLQRHIADLKEALSVVREAPDADHAGEQPKIEVLQSIYRINFFRFRQ
jgi:hypothetical protein